MNYFTVGNRVIPILNRHFLIYGNYNNFHPKSHFYTIRVYG